MASRRRLARRRAATDRRGAGQTDATHSSCRVRVHSLTLRLPYTTSESDRSARAVREIERLYNEFLARLHPPEKLRFLDANVSDPKLVVFTGMVNISHRLQFLLYSNVAKTRNLLEALEWALSSGNYLVWTLVVRALIEHSAVLSKYLASLEKLNFCAPETTLDELDAVGACLLKYMNGSRFNWDALLSDDWESLLKKFEPPGDEAAINVLTAIDHSAKLRPALSTNRIWYDMLSDFAHPNKASHSLHLAFARANNRDEVAVTDVHLSPATPAERAEFIVRWTLPAVLVNAGSIEASLRRLLPAVALWSARCEGSVELTGASLRFYPLKNAD